jgi:hypothetical protein
MTRERMTLAQVATILAKHLTPEGRQNAAKELREDAEHQEEAERRLFITLAATGEVYDSDDRAAELIAKLEEAGIK